MRCCRIVISSYLCRTPKNENKRGRVIQRTHLIYTQSTCANADWLKSCEFNLRCSLCDTIAYSNGEYIWNAAAVVFSNAVTPSWARSLIAAVIDLHHPNAPNWQIWNQMQNVIVSNWQQWMWHLADVTWMHFLLFHYSCDRRKQVWKTNAWLV